MAIIRRANCLKRRSGKSVEKKVKKVSHLILTFSGDEKIKKVLAIVSDLLYSIRCTIVVQWHFYAIF